MAMDIYQAVTDRIIEAIESGYIPWTQPWIGGIGDRAVSYTTGKPYSLLNQLLLLCGEDSNGPGEYITFKKAVELGGYVRKGEKGHMVVFWKWLDKKDDNGEVVIGDNGKPEKIPLLKKFTVFHVSQCEGIKPHQQDEKPGMDLKPDEKADAVVNGYIIRSGVKLEIMESSQAYYQPATDKVVVPTLTQHKSVSEFYSTLFHELGHSTGHHSRLNRITDVAAFGSESYSKEELVAEISSAFLVNYCGLETADSFRNSAGYLQGWLKALKDDKKLIISAAGKAQKAVEMIVGEEESEDEEAEQP